MGRWWRACAGGVVMLLGVLGCSNATDSPVRSVRSIGGPLSVSDAVGGFAFTAPAKATTWRGSFGDFVLCTKTSGTVARLENVTTSSRVSPRSVSVWIHRVAAGRKSSQQFISALGSPPTWHQSYADDHYAGRWHRGVRNVTIKQLCPAAHRRSAGVTELVFVVQADRKGADVTSATVNYRVGKQHYAARIHWQMALCGSARRLRTTCQS